MAYKTLKLSAAVYELCDHSEKNKSATNTILSPLPRSVTRNGVTDRQVIEEVESEIKTLKKRK